MIRRIKRADDRGIGNLVPVRGDLIRDVVALRRKGQWWKRTVAGDQVGEVLMIVKSLYARLMVSHSNNTVR